MADNVTFIIERSGQNLVVRTRVQRGAVVEWKAPPGMSLEIDFVAGSPDGSTTTVTGSDQGSTPLAATNLGRFPYKCTLKDSSGTTVAEGDPSKPTWGGEVEVTPTGRGH